jgi:hypothetical protein
MKTLKTTSGHKLNTTLAQAKAGQGVFDAPIYKTKPYVLLQDNGAGDVMVSASGSIGELCQLGEYFDDCAVDIRRYDLNLTCNTTVASGAGSQRSDTRIADALAVLGGHERGRKVLVAFRKLCESGAAGLDSAGCDALLALTEEFVGGRRDFVNKV